MTNRIIFLVLALFWMTMTYLLWRSEYVGQAETGASVPLEVVWRKILTAPDNSSLEVLHHGHKVGYCRLASSVGQELATGKALTDEIPTDATARAAGGYRLSFDGNVALSDTMPRLGFESEIRMATNQDWQEFNARIKMRPMVWEVHTAAREQSIHLMTGDQDGRSEEVFKFSDLQNPQALMQEFDLPAALAVAGVLGPLLRPHQGSPPAMGLAWKVRNDWISIGHTSVRVYRLDATLLDRYRMRVIISHVGEVLRVDLPDDWEVVNDELISL